MTISARVISIFVTIFILGFVAAKSTSAEYLLRPITDNSQLSILNYQLPITDSFSPNQLLIIDNDINYKPSITFGDLIASSSSSDFTKLPSVLGASTVYGTNNQPASGTDGQFNFSNFDYNSSSRSALIRNLLARLENSYNESQQLLSANQLSNISQNYQPSTTGTSTLPGNYQLSTNSPTPYIPIPTLIAGINEIVRNNQTLSTSYQLPSPNSQVEQTYNTSPPFNPNYQLTPTPYPIINYASPTPSINLQPTPTPKNIYSIAFLGDSMIDTLGHDLPDMQKLLKAAYPSKSFILLNYGQGATDMENGLFRLTHATTYLDKNYAPLLSFKPDILVIESFAYNHWSGATYDLDRQWTTLVKIIETVKEISPGTKIILAATIGPNSEIYGDGKLNWNFDLKWQASNLTKIYLENMSRFAAASRLPFADAFHPSLGPDGNGFKIYINNGDHLHPSPEGAQFFSQKVVDMIKNSQMIQ